jgi:hypothetical protein
MIAVAIPYAAKAADKKPTPARSIASSSVSKAQFIRALQTNHVVAAAIADAKAYSGAKTCTYAFPKLADAPGFEKGSTIDFSVRINCSVAGDTEGSDASGLVDVEGRWFNGGSGPQEIDKLAIHFAG